MFSTMTWLNKPPQWSIDAEGQLHVTTGERTDFWRETFYGFVHDNGHFLHAEVDGDFTATVTMSAGYDALYDQSGLMLRVDETIWLKTGIELTDGATHLSTVATHDHSDWSMVPLATSDVWHTIRISRHGCAVRVQYRANSSWQMLRLAYLELPGTVQVGVMCCSPERAGLAVTFRDFKVTDPIPAQLHE